MIEKLHECGASLREGARFCPHCGKSMQTVVESPPVTPQATSGLDTPPPDRGHSEGAPEFTGITAPQRATSLPGVGAPAVRGVSMRDASGPTEGVSLPHAEVANRKATRLDRV